MLSPHRSLISISFNDFRYIVHIMSRRIGIFLKCMQLFVLRYLCDKLLQIGKPLLLLRWRL